MLRRPLATSFLLALLYLPLGCGYGPFNSLSDSDQQRFEQCWRSSLRFRANVCGAADNGGGVLDPAGLTTENCEDTGKHLYVDQPGEEARRQWLLESECPARLVGDAT